MTTILFSTYIFQCGINIVSLLLAIASGDGEKGVFFGSFLAMQTVILYLMASHRISSRPYASFLFMSLGFTLLARATQLPQFQARCPSVLHPIFVIASALFLLAGLFVFDKKN